MSFASIGSEAIRLFASLKAGTVAPSAMLKNLRPTAVRTNSTWRCKNSAGSSARCSCSIGWKARSCAGAATPGLNKSEQRHSLAQVICTFKQGRIADRGIEAQQFRASGLNLVIAAIVYWNSTYIADAVAHLRATGEAVPDELLAHTTPLSWEHIGLSGDFLWDRAAATADKRRPLNLAPKSRRLKPGFLLRSTLTLLAFISQRQ